GPADRREYRACRRRRRGGNPDDRADGPCTAIYRGSSCPESGWFSPGSRRAPHRRPYCDRPAPYRHNRAGRRSPPVPRAVTPRAEGKSSTGRRTRHRPACRACCGVALVSCEHAMQEPARRLFRRAVKPLPKKPVAATFRVLDAIVVACQARRLFQAGPAPALLAFYIRLALFAFNFGKVLQPPFGADPFRPFRTRDAVLRAPPAEIERGALRHLRHDLDGLGPVQETQRPLSLQWHGMCQPGCDGGHHPGRKRNGLFGQVTGDGNGPAENIAPKPGADTVHELRKTCLGTIPFLAEIRLPGRHRALRFHRQPDEIESATGVEAGAGCGE